MDMRVQIAGVELKNPVVTASGTFGYGQEFTPYGDLKKLGGISVKGLSLKPRKGNPMPRLVETASGMLNAIGIQNVGVEEFLGNKLPKLPWKETAIIANLYASSVEEFGDLAGLFADEEGVALLEVNVSCPNVKAGGSAFGQDPTLIRKVTEMVRSRSKDKPVMVKLSPNVTDITVAARAAEEGGAHAISLINTISGMAVDIRRRRPCLANVVGGLSGPAVKPVALRCVHQACNAVTIPAMGMGGISCAQDALEFILVGAHAIQVGTGNFIRPDFSFRLVDEIEALADELGLSNWDEFRGTLQV
ncbi:MAG: dihydroorotate dehydrogenase [Desulfovibrio sp.]|uniref:dihydroorotate dehydrogenase n=1 Tax=Desulfovibrio sp. 7SRBS1 TaxID=3378064 RepID=UPI003B3F844F